MSGLVAFSATVLGGWIIFNLIGAFIVGAAARARSVLQYCRYVAAHH